MSNRSAVDTIKGYFYQFDYSIKRILELNNDSDSIVIEQIEDIDIKTATETTAIQCKYYSKTKYNHSVIAKPIRFMLLHFINLKNNGQSPIKYLLYGYFSEGQDKLALPLSLTDLKDKFLTYIHSKEKHFHYNEINATDDDLEEFLSLLAININTQEYKAQLNSIFEKLKVVFNCTDFEAEHFFYNNALKIIKELSVKDDVQERTIKKQAFLEQINSKSILFNQWFIEYKGLTKHFRELRKEYFTNLNTSPFERFFLIEINKNNYSRSELKELIFLISKKWSKISQRDKKTSCPYLYVDGIEENELINLKTELITENFKFVDGYDFFGAQFNPRSIIIEPNFHNGVNIKIINEKNFIDFILNEISTTKEIYQFYFDEPFYDNDSISLKHIKIQIKEIENIKEII